MRGPVIALVFCVAGCSVDNVGTGEAVGREGRAIFRTKTELAFSSRLVVGSTFDVTLRATDPKDEEVLSRATLGSSDQGKMAVDGNTVTVLEAGSYELLVLAAAEDGGALIDAIKIRAAVPAATMLVDGDLLAATDSVDARLTAAFAITAGSTNTLLVSAVDRCGGDLLDLYASTIETSNAAATVDSTGPAQFSLKTEVPGSLDVTLVTPGLDPLVYSVLSIDASEVDEVRPAVARLDENGNLTLWGRAFANDVELAGPMSFTWSADARVTLSALRGPAVIATVSFPADGEPPDDRPAVVTTEIFGETGTLDLLGQLAQETTRGDPPRKFEGPTPRGGCSGDACDPAAATAIVGFVGLRRLRRAMRRVS